MGAFWEGEWDICLTVGHSMAATIAMAVIEMAV
jgi:hypothetical protein